MQSESSSALEGVTSAIDTAVDSGKNLQPVIDHHVLKLIAEESSKDDQLNDSILSF